MRPSSRTAASRPRALILLGTTALLFPLSGLNCPDTGNGNDNGDGAGSAPQITINVSTDLDIPADQPFSVVYSMTGDPFEAIAFYDTDGIADSGDEFVLASGLATGTDQSFMFNTPDVPLGTYDFGIRATNSVGTTTQYAVKSDGTRASVRVNGLPQPVINSPSSTTEILLNEGGQPSTLDLVFSCNDPENEIGWEIFYDTNAFLDGNGEVTIETGTGNALPGSSNQTINWLIPSTLDLGTYYIGLICSETSQSGSEAVLYSQAQVILTDELSIPSLTVTGPTSDVTVEPDTEDKTFQVTWNISGTSPTTNDSVRVFVDTDEDLTDGGDISVATGLAPLSGVATVNAAQLADSPDSGYFIGALIQRDGQSGTASYAAGKLFITGQGNLVVTAPSSALTVTPGTNVTVNWNTNVSVGDATVSLTLLDSNSAGTPGAPSDVVPDPFEDSKELATSVQSALLETDNLTSGFYVVEVRLTFEDESEEDLVGYTAPIRITTTPFTFWVGLIELDEDQESDPPTGHFDGLVFEGNNFENNAGSSLLRIGDVDDRGGEDFIIASRFAKPNFDNPGGIGSGAAYLVYSDARFSRGNRRFNLSAVGLDTQDPDEIGGEDPDPNTLPGLVFTGIRFDTTSEDIDNDGSAGDGVATPTGTGCFTEDADGDGKLDQYDEDLNGDTSLDALEDIDGDSNLDINEDGYLWADDNCDDVPDAGQPAGAPFFDAQYVNGYLDTDIAEDRDGDDALDDEGDHTYGLSSLGLLPDVDGDEFPELVFGFAQTDSIKPTRAEDAGTGFASLLQPNQFHRGGIVVIPTADELQIKDRTMGDLLDGERILDLDRAGQSFFNYGSLGEDEVEGSEDNTGTGIIGATPENRPFSGMDAFPLVDDVLGGDSPNSCGENELALTVVNSALTNTVLVPRFTIEVANAPVADPGMRIGGRAAIACIPCAANDTVEVTLTEVGTFDPEVNEEDFNGPLVVVDEDDGMADNASCGENMIFAVVGPDNSTGDYGAFWVCSGDPEDDNCDLEDIGDSFGCTEATGGDEPGEGTNDGCYDTMLGPLFGFSYAGLTGGTSSLDEPSHPLAYDETLSNPQVRAEEFAFLALNGEDGLCNDCGKLVNLPAFIREGIAPPFNTISSGFYPGSILPPVGARILGQGVGDHFGASIASLTLPAGQQLAYVSSPQRNNAAGVVYQWRMRQYWDEIPTMNEDDLLVPTGGLATVDGGGGRPKPHQYIIKNGGFDTPNAVSDTVESSIRNAVLYTGIDAGDELGTRVLGVTDFNAAGGMDLVLTAPGADTDDGAAYIVYNPSPSNSVDLADIARSPTDPERVDGMIIQGDADTRFGEALAGNCDLNDDGADDLVFGIPAANGNRGEVLIVYGCKDPSDDICEEYLTSPANGWTIDQLVGLGVAVRIQGLDVGDQLGFNIACDGDFTGDGVDDLVFSAPGATPMFDSDGNDTLDAPGLDLDKDGIPDTDDDGNLLLADPSEAGLIYVVTNAANVSGTVSITTMGSTLRGFTFIGATGGDMLGGGTESKRGTRSDGLIYGGDLDADGNDDLLVSSILADPSGKTNAGEVYVIYGFDEEDAAELLQN